MSRKCNELEGEGDNRSKGNEIERVGGKEW
jgi:hypothetical protein